MNLLTSFACLSIKNKTYLQIVLTLLMEHNNTYEFPQRYTNKQTYRTMPTKICDTKQNLLTNLNVQSKREQLTNCTDIVTT